MVGVIRARDILRHPFTTISCFGWRTFYRALTTDSQATFLSLLGDTYLFNSTDSEAVSVMRRCIDLELQAKCIYETLAEFAAPTPPAAKFFSVLAQQEQEHADLLQICLASSQRSGWKHNRFNPWRDYLSRLEHGMREAEYAASAVDNLDDAFRLVLRIESSEINQIFRGALEVGNSSFPRRLAPFQTAVEKHIGYIVTEISRLAPNMKTDSSVLRSTFPCST